MIEIFLNISAGILFLAITYFLIQYALKFQQERLKLEDYRNEVLAEKAKISEEITIRKAKEKEEEKRKEHQTKLKDGYRLWKWKGIELWMTHDEEGLKPYKKIKYRETNNRWKTIKHVEGIGYFKSFSDLTMYLSSDFIELKYWEIL